jgi:hypothetical protein
LNARWLALLIPAAYAVSGLAVYAAYSASTLIISAVALARRIRNRKADR